MKIKVRKYELDGEFKNAKEAKETFLVHFPLVNEKDLDAELKKKFKNANQSDNLKEQNTDGGKQHAKTGKGSTRGQQSGED